MTKYSILNDKYDYNIKAYITKKGIIYLFHKCENHAKDNKVEVIMFLTYFICKHSVLPLHIFILKKLNVYTSKAEYWEDSRYGNKNPSNIRGRS